MSRDTVGGLLTEATQALRRAGIDPGDARHLVAAALRIPRDRFTLHLGDTADAADRQTVAGLVDDRLCGIPVSRITGRRAFWGRDFAVTSDVLDPRPETETLMALALSEKFDGALDLGTGSGCILISLLVERRDTHGLGTDVSDGALRTARANAATHGVADRARFAVSDWFDCVRDTYDLIVSNPPYIAEAEMAALDREVRDHDPRIALTPGGDGLDAYRAIAAGVAGYLSPGGRLLVEIGPTQADAVVRMLGDGGLVGIGVNRDLDGRDRVISARRPA